MFSSFSLFGQGTSHSLEFCLHALHFHVQGTGGISPERQVRYWDPVITFYFCTLALMSVQVTSLFHIVKP